MKGEPRIIERLNEALFLELGAVNQYWLHYRLLDDWGFKKLAKKERAESIEEMHHARPHHRAHHFLEGHPNLQKVGALRIGQTVKEVLEADLAGEYDARTSYKASREICHDLGDLRHHEALRGAAEGRGKAISTSSRPSSTFSTRSARSVRPPQRGLRGRSRVAITVRPDRSCGAA